jgi:hypothetical protein
MWCNGYPTWNAFECQYTAAVANRVASTTDFTGQLEEENMLNLFKFSSHFDFIFRHDIDL